MSIHRPRKKVSRPSKQVEIQIATECERKIFLSCTRFLQQTNINKAREREILSSQGAWRREQLSRDFSLSLARCVLNWAFANLWNWKFQIKSNWLEFQLFYRQLSEFISDFSVNLTVVFALLSLSLSRLHPSLSLSHFPPPEFPKLISSSSWLALKEALILLWFFSSLFSLR